MKRRGCSSSTSAAIEDMKKFMDDQLELFKSETEKMLEQMINQVIELKDGSNYSKNEGENEKEIEDAGIEDLSSVKGRRKSRRTIKEPAWMKDFMTV
ncbi:hypothetical protein DCAR_0207579 [Daucus carota subsp. sativus]|uniref:Uncharacterized protein n=1 Tax=Daucus carota subsp. sativus TaxID=79200 RepID=A0AAF0WFS6_DAUCS|nr:hypothetical protein DCAR_0207579 [Daucus carota subsp. sativus]